MADSVPVVLSRIEAKLAALDERLDEATAELRGIRGDRSKLATVSEAVKTHSRLFWAFGSGMVALFVDRLGKVL